MVATRHKSARRATPLGQDEHMVTSRPTRAGRAGTTAHWLSRALPTVPGITTLRHYRRRWLRGDIVAGITVTAYLVPQVMAYATVAGLPPIVGLWTMIPVLAVYAVFGSSRVMSVGPESTTALMSAATVGPLAGGDPGRYAAIDG